MSPGFETSPHNSVLYHEIIHMLQPNKGGLFVDCTLGGGGHAFGILEASAPNGMLLGFDVDRNALEISKRRLARFKDRAILVQTSYVNLQEQLERLNWKYVNGILLDLGVSSMQLDTPSRGFSFLADAPLDMRFDPETKINAYDIVNKSSEKELADFIYLYGDEPLARQIARSIVRSRPVTTTKELSSLISDVYNMKRLKEKYRRSTRYKVHPATRTFQAIRIAVNQELKSLELVLPLAVEALTSGGRLAVISFHSLEDRLVKHYFRRESKGCVCPPHQPMCTCGHIAKVVEITRKPICPSAKEVASNPRARSARLRVVERLTPGSMALSINQHPG